MTERPKPIRLPRTWQDPDDVRALLPELLAMAENRHPRPWSLTYEYDGNKDMGFQAAEAVCLRDANGGRIIGHARLWKKDSRRPPWTRRWRAAFEVMLMKADEASTEALVVTGQLA
jgi:hypothetical protein